MPRGELQIHALTQYCYLIRVFTFVQIAVNFIQLICLNQHPFHPDFEII